MRGEELKKNITRKGLFRRLKITESLKEVESEVTLGRAILDKAVLDSVNDEETFKWFDVENEEFQDVCFIAYLEPEFVLEKFTLIIGKLKKHE